MTGRDKAWHCKPTDPRASCCRMTRDVKAETSGSGSTDSAVRLAELMAALPATGRPIQLEGINIFRVENGCVVEQRAEPDFFGLLQQIGAIPQA